MRGSPFRSTLALAIAIWVAGLAASGVKADPMAAGGGSRVAVVLFLSYQIPGAPGFDVGALHAGCWDRLAANVHGLGHGEVSRTEIEPLVNRWGVRTALLASEGFLKEVAAGFDAGELLICDLIIYADRLVLCARSVRTDTGRIAWADIEDMRLPSEVEAAQGPALKRWFDASEGAGQRLLGRWNSRVAREDRPASLFLLPIRTAGLEAAVGRLVTCCLLRSLLESPENGIEDPGVTFSRLREAGVDPQLPDRRTRSILGGLGVPAVVLVSDLVVYGSSDGVSQSPLFDEEANSSVTPVPASALSLRMIDADSGIVIFSATEYLGVPSTRGLFGVVRDVPLVQRVQPVTDRLVHAAMQKG